MTVEEEYVREIKVNGLSASARSSLANDELRIRDDLDKAERFYFEALKDNRRGQASILFLTALAYSEHGHFQWALQCTTDAHTLWKENYEIVALHILCLEKLGTEDEAERLLQQFHAEKAKPIYVDQILKVVDLSKSEEVETETLTHRQQSFISRLQAIRDVDPINEDHGD